MKVRVVRELSPASAPPGLVHDQSLVGQQLTYSLGVLPGHNSNVNAEALDGPNSANPGPLTDYGEGCNPWTCCSLGQMRITSEPPGCPEEAPPCPQIYHAKSVPPVCW